MELIDKDKVVKEVERRVEAIRKAFNEPGILSGVDRTYANAQSDAFKSLLPFLDTLEVKEMDLEEDVDRILEEYDWNYDKIDFYEFAKHFFELGLKTKKVELEL